MEINGLLMDSRDNVVTCVTCVPAGQPVVYRRGDTVCTLTAQEEIPYCHKIALSDLEKGDQVIKYGELIGRTTEPVGKGHWVSHNNIYSVPRDYEHEFLKSQNGKENHHGVLGI
ncbi:MAG: UxaA family hydrolase [Lachnospiraceae bacterium]|nr:UxaA family hydrolase [Lachnospiraceae bacterium]